MDRTCLRKHFTTTPHIGYITEYHYDVAMSSNVTFVTRQQIYILVFSRYLLVSLQLGVLVVSGFVAGFPCE